MEQRLFQPDNFSQVDIKYKKIEGDRTIFNNILKSYFPDFQIKEIFQLDRSEINSQNFKITLSVDGEDKKFLLRKHQILSDARQLNFYLDIISILNESGVKVSRVVDAIGGEKIVRLDDEIYTLFDFIEAKYFLPTENGFGAVAEEIAKMHREFANFDEKQISSIDSFSKKSGVYYNKIKSYSENDFLEIEEIIMKKQHKNQDDTFFLNNLELIKKIIRDIKSKEKDIDLLPKQITHSDLHPHNILMMGDEVGAIIDFDAIRISQRARDVVFAMYRFGRQFFVNSSNKDALSRAPMLNKLFIDNYNEVNKLSDEEIRLMPALIADEILTRTLFVLNGIYKERHFLWAKDFYKFMAAVREINYFWPNG